MTTNRLEDLPDCLNVREAAQVLRVSASTVYEAVRTGQIAAVRVRRRLVIPKRAITDMLDSAARGGQGTGGT